MSEPQNATAPQQAEAARTSARFGFVILHYLAYDMTCECVDNLLTRFGAYDIHIVIVDNASPNGTGKQLVDRYAGNDRVTVLLADDNLGFARGNNLGYDWLLAHYDPDFAIVMNNDVLIEQDEFLDLIPQVYADTHFAVLGPDIWSPRAEKHQNPDSLRLMTDEELTTFIRQLEQFVNWPGWRIAGNLLAGKVTAPVNSAKRKRAAKSLATDIPAAQPYEQVQKNVKLHGSCYIFSRVFFAAREYCFYPETFLYAEEDILLYQCQENNLTVVYSPNLHVIHLEDVSTNMVSQSAVEKWRTKRCEMLRSFKLFAKLRGLAV